MTKNVKNKTIKKKRALLIAFMIFALAVLATVCVYETELNKLDSNNRVDNSFYDSQFKNKKIMVIVPHEDDDLLSVGQVLPQLYKNGADVRIVVATNGDKTIAAHTRQDEDCRALKKLGIPREKVTFLGYPDGTNMYVKKAGEKTYSYSTGLNHTYAGAGFRDYHFQKFGTHAEYTAENLIGDMESVIREYRPDYIIATDFDNHTDHRGISMSFETAMSRILKSEDDYHPKILKSFCYTSTWKAKPDFYSLNIKSVHKPTKEKLRDPSYETNVPQYNWSDRVRIPVYKGSVSHSLLRCPEYKALGEHLSQYAFVYSDRIINGDMVYWTRRTDNLINDADVSVSSGEAELINNFMLVNVKKIRDPHAKLTGCVSKFNNNDAEKSVTVKFKHPKTVSCISLYDDFDLSANITGGIITFSDGSNVKVPKLNANGSETRVVFEPKHNITSFTFKVTGYEKSAGLCEIEAFEQADYDPGFSLIKLKNAETDDYIYNYFIRPDENSLTLGAYLSDPNAEYSLRIVDGDGVKLDGNKLIFDNDFKKCTVRAELKDDPSTYDQITVERLNESGLKKYELFEKVNRLFFKIDSFRLKTKNLFVNGYFYETLHKYVKMLGDKIGINIK